MKAILVFVVTADGKVTKWGDPFVRKWSSEEDQKYFTRLMRSSSLVIMGINTFKADPIKPRAGRLMVIMTRHPEEYKSYEVKGQLEFSEKSPIRLLEVLSSLGHQRMLVVGGPHVAASFLKERLIDEIWLTVEPLVFGSGGSFVAEEKLDVRLELISMKKINHRGTILLKYRVDR